MSTISDDDAQFLADKRVVFVGKLGGVTKREAQQLVRQSGGIAVEKLTSDVDLVVVGADELPLLNQDEFLDQDTRRAAAEGRLEIISETVLWQRLGLVENEQNVRRLYTPAMLAELLGVSVATIRRWHRRGLIVPAREVRRLPYFDFQEVATARRLAQLLAAGASPAAIERQLAELSRYVPEVERPLAQLSVIVEGRRLLLRQGEGLIEPGGQLRFDFEALEQNDREDGIVRRPTVSLEEYLAESVEPPSADELLAFAAELEDAGHLDQAAEMIRVVLSAIGPVPDLCFQLAELLYRLGDLPAARERYYMAIELDENFVEARANLGCVLAESGQHELAVAAFEGALRYHGDYPDVHYHLARTLDDIGNRDDADRHWERFLELAPNSPWADEARLRLQRTHLTETLR
ncbi:MAG: MerR family transcriptional regulator [Pirellulaceae bacterium]|nr:MerR family transcriptional regulator [Pirellulaceae bacterium]